MKVYVAGAFKDWEIVRDVQARLISAGIEITYDWTHNALSWPGVAPDDVMLAGAKDDILGVREADLVFVITTDSTTRGAWSELGMALVLEKKVIVCGPQADLNVFAWLCERFKYRGEAINRILELHSYNEGSS